jgi:PAS domain S-box-containing protein
MRVFPLWLKITILLILAVLLAGGSWLYYSLRQRALQDVNANLESITKLKINQINDWRATRLSEAAVVTESPYYNKLVVNWTGTSKADAEMLLLRFDIVRKHYQVNDAMLISTAGEIYLRLSNKTGKLDKAVLRALDEAFHTRKPVMSELYLSTGESLPQIDIVMPFFIQSGNSFIPQNAILYQYNARHYLYPLLQSWPVSNRSSEMLLVRRDGDSVLYLNDLRYNNIKAFSMRIPISRSDLPVAIGLLGKQGVMQGKDYRGVKVLAYSTPVPDTTWHMIAKIDESEAFSAMRRESALMIGLISFLIVSVAATTGVLWQRNEKAHYRDMFEAENAQHKIEARYRRTLDCIKEGCQILNYEWRYLYINATAIWYSGRTEGELLGHTLMEAYPGIESTDFFAALQRCMNERIPQVMEDLITDPDGSKQWIEFSIQPIPEGIFILSSVITSHKIAEESLKESAARYRTLFEHMTQGVFRITADKQLIDINPAALKMLGYSTKEEFIHKGSVSSVGDAIHEDGSPHHDMEQLQAVALRTGTPTSSVAGVLNQQSGTRVWMEIGAIPEFSEGDSKPCQILMTMHDITDLLKLQKDKERLQEQFLHSQKMESVGRLAGGVAHDFNNMLSVILGYANLSLEAIDDSHPLFMYLQEINKAASRSADLTSQLLAFARKQTIAPIMLDLNDAINKALNLLRRLIGESIELAYMLRHDLWPVVIDPAQVNQILTNLVINARDAIENIGRITIETENMVIDEDYCSGHPDFIVGEYIVLSVSDNGRGMGKEILDHLFEPFFTTKKIGEGTGLGLATVYGIIKQNAGFINVYSEPGKGSIFRVYFPRLSRSTFPEKNEIRNEPPKRGLETIMLVEDEIAVKNLTKTMLERMGYTVIDSSTPRDALSLAGKYNGEIHLLLADVIMPEMTGRDLSEQLKLLRPNLKQMFMSGYTADVIAHHGVLDKGIIFIQKPFSVKMLAEKVREALDN